MKNWYCKPASEVEAIEIVERAVANGARASDLVKGMSGGVERYYWNEYSHWGVLDGYTHANVAKRWGGAEHLTSQQVREQFPLPHEVNDMSDKKEWQGPQDGFPPIGFHGEIKWGKNLKYLECVVIPDNTVAMFDNGKWVVSKFFGDAKFRHLRTEREKWVSDAQKHCTEFSSNQLGKLYDAIKSGALKVPEAE